MVSNAIAWSDSATTGDIAVAAAALRGDLAQGRLDCELAPAGKFRNGAPRWWCRSHQAYWGVKADLARADGCCRGAAHAWSVLTDPLVIDLADAGPLSLARDASGGVRINLDHCVPALALRVAPGSVFRQTAIVQVNVTPPALAALATADGCVDCARCGYPHLDLGAFASRAHRRHTCGHCGHDATHSAGAIVSNPLWLLARAWAGRLRFSV